MMLTRKCLAIAVPFLLAFTSSVTSQDNAKKTAIPTTAAQAEATKLIKEVYGDEWVAAKTSTEKQALAKKLLGKANESKDDPANQFVLLRLARDIGTQAADGQTAFQAIDVMAETFQVDVLEMKAVVLTKLAPTVRTPEQHKSVAEDALTLVEQAINQDSFTVADQLGKLALAEARKAGEKELATQAQGKVTEVAELAKGYEDVKAAKATLEKTPDDPEADLVIGKYLCFAKGDWEKGLPMLALGKDEGLKILAQKEVQGAASSSEQAKLGDGWWNVAENEKGSAKKQIHGRAGYWYRKALPGLSGVMKDKVEKRVAEINTPERPVKSTTAKPAAKSQRISKKPKLYAFTDEATVKRDWNLKGNWRIENSGIRLYGGDATLTSIQQYKGDLALQITYDMDDNCEMWVSLWGETFSFGKTGKTVSPPSISMRFTMKRHAGSSSSPSVAGGSSPDVAVLVRKGSTVRFTWGSNSPQTIKLKEAQLDSPSAIEIHLDRKNLWRAKMELVVHGISIKTTVQPSR